MPLNRRNTKEFNRVLRAGVNLQRLELHKRGDDQQQGTVVTHVLFTCWRDKVTRTGQTLRGPLTANTRTTWHIPAAELRRCGVAYLSATDKFYDPVDKAWWTPYAEQSIAAPLQGNVIDVECKGTDPLGPNG